MLVIDEYLFVNSPLYGMWYIHVDNASDSVKILFFQGPKRSHVQKLMNILQWTNTLFFSMAPLFGWSRFSYEGNGTSCTVEYFPNDGYESYIVSSTVVCFLVPILIMVICLRKYSTVTGEQQNVSRISVNTTFKHFISD
jgi:hypothetical protein